jgi:peptide/nickel transport system permease protein
MDNYRNIDNFERVLAEADRAYRGGDRTEARRLSFMAAQLNPNDERPWLILGAMAAPRASIFYLHKALELNPKSEAALKGLVWASERLPRPEDIPTVPIKTERIPVETKPETLPAVATAVEKTDLPQNVHTSTFLRVAKYTLVRGIALFASIVASIFLIVYIANLGGYLDTIQKALINEDINGMLMGGWLKEIPYEQRQPIIDQTRSSMEASYGLDKPYLLRSINWMYRGITFDWGKSRTSYIVSSIYKDGVYARDITSDDIRTLIVTYLPRTLLLFGLSNLGLFLVSILIALPLATKPNKWANRLVMWLAPTSSIPSWLIGLVLLALIYNIFGNYSFKLGFNQWSSTFNIQFVPTILKNLLLPFFAILISKFFQCVYSLRNYFLIFSREDYIDLARAKGLPENMLQRRYILRPALPSILTSFALIMISIWQECIAVEYFFNIGGVGGFFMKALNGNDIAVVVALVATFAYFLAITVFLLDIVYALIDPRVRIGNHRQSEEPEGRRNRIRLSFDLFEKKPHPSKPHDSSFPVARVPLGVSIKSWLAGQAVSIRQTAAGIGHSLSDAWREIRQYPTAVIGISIIVLLTIISVTTVIVVPYQQAVSLWRGDEKAWIRNPKLAPPQWTNFFRKDKLPENIDLSSTDQTVEKVVTAEPDGTNRVTMTFPFDFPYSTYPQDILVLFTPNFSTKKPFVSMTWVTPDGREIPVSHFGVSRDSSYTISQDAHIASEQKRNSSIEALFTKPAARSGEVLKGRYQLKVDAILFEKNNDLDAEMVVFGQVYGFAGTDISRRDLSLILLWGLAVALSFGILAAVGTTISSVSLAAAGVWFGGWVDGLIQRISEINMVLPMLPISIMIFYLYSKSFWVILGVTVGLSIFGNSIKNYRAMFMQIVELPYIEAASTYGAPDWRIIFHYMIPRIRNVFIPQLVILVPSYIFFETTLTFLGVSDPSLPTLGKLLYSIMKTGIFTTPIYISIEAVVVLLLISIGFVFLGYGLERSYNDITGI